MNGDRQFEDGLQMRKQVMGAAFVDKAFAGVDAFTAPLQEFVTRNAWGTTWCRDGLDLKTRSLLTLSMLTALGRATDEFAARRMDSSIRSVLAGQKVDELEL